MTKNAVHDRLLSPLVARNFAISVRINPFLLDRVGRDAVLMPCYVLTFVDLSAEPLSNDDGIGAGEVRLREVRPLLSPRGGTQKEMVASVLSLCSDPMSQGQEMSCHLISIRKAAAGS